MVDSRYSRMGTVLLALLLMVSVLAVIAVDSDPADAAFPGTNGKIVYERDGDIWTMNADGSGQALLYAGVASIERQPAWSPDGTKIAFSSDRSTVDASGPNIWIMNADGSSPVQITKKSVVESFKPQWSPDGVWILFERFDDFEVSGTATTGTVGTTLVQLGQTFITKGVAVGMKISVPGKPLATSVAAITSETTLSVNAGALVVGDTYTISQDQYFVFLIKADGTGEKSLSAEIVEFAPKVYSDLAPSWSPKGDKIAFATGRNGANDIYTASISPSAGTSLTGIANRTADPGWFDSSEEPAWSPDGTKIVFQTQRSGTPATQGFENLWVMDATAGASASGVQLTDSGLVDLGAAWSPDGTKIVFRRDSVVPFTDSEGELYVVPAAGGALTRLTTTANLEKQPNWQRLLVATDDGYPVTVGGTVAPTTPGVMTNDVGLGGNALVTASVVAAPTHAASFTFNADGSFSYTHDGSQSDDSFTYRVTDSGGNVSNIATVTLTLPGGQAPVANPNAYSVENGGTVAPAAPGVLGNDTDAEDGVPATAVLKTGPANASSFTLNADGSFSYTHNGSATRSDSFTYQAKDSGGKLSNVATVTISIGSSLHTVVLVDSGLGRWHLYDAAGVEKTSFFFGNPGDFPIYGDWDGDGIETPGLYRQSDGFVYLRNSNTQGVADIRFFFGNPGDVPIAGDFNNNGFDTVSIYRPSNQTFFIINKLGANDGGLGAAEFSYVFGNPGDKPFVGDFNGNGTETVGLHRESTGLVYFRNTHTQGNADNQFIFGNPGDRLVAGDWTGDDVFTPGLFRPSNTTMFFRHTNTQGNADNQWVGGQTSWLPVSGNNGLG